MKFNVLSLFSGVGGFEVGFMRTGKFSPVAFCERDKYSQKVLRKNFPEVPIFDDVCSLTKDKIKEVFSGKIDVICGGFPCFPKGTRVYTSSGYKPIESVVPGDEVLTHRGRMRKVSKTFINPESDLLELKIQGIRRHRTTKEHPYYVINKIRKWNNERRGYDNYFSDPYWKEAKDLVKGDLVCSPHIFESTPTSIQDEILWIVGRYVADGHLGSKNNLTFFNIGKAKETEFLKNTPSFKFFRREMRTAIRFCCYDKRIKKLCESTGSISHNKKVPHWVHTLPEDKIKIFLDGYMSGDGCFTLGCFKATSVSIDLIQGIQMLIAKAYNANSSYLFFKRPSTCVIEGRVVNQRDTHTIQFNKEIKKQNNAYFVHGMVWTPVREIKYLENREVVYNIEVEEDNSYTVENVCVHNCQDISVAGQKRGFTNESGQTTRSGLWVEYKRIIQEVRPRWIIIENVPNLRNIGLGQVLKDLWESGYNAEWKIISARSMGANHLRERIWIVCWPSYCNNKGLEGQRGSGEVSEVCPQEEIGSNAGRGAFEIPSNGNLQRFWPMFTSQKEASRWRSETPTSFGNWWTAQSEFCGVDDELPKGLDIGGRSERGRKERIRQMGNAVVPAIPELIARRIIEIEKDLIL